MSAWTLRLLGLLAIESPAGAMPLRLGRKGQALLVCVAAHGSAGVPRARLMSLLWEDHNSEHARSALRQCLYQVRTELGDAASIFVAEADRLAVSEAHCEVDTQGFETLARAASVPALLAAAARYRGDFAEGVEAGVEFGQWASTERERLRDLAHGVVARLSEHALDADAFDDAVALAHRLLATDRVHEGTWRALMRLHMQAGLGSKALQCWADCRRALREELGVEPSPSTAALAATLAAEPAKSTPGETTDAGEVWRAASSTPPGSPLWSHDDPRVLDLMLRGWQLFTTYTAHGHAKARQVYEQVLECAPQHPDALVLIGWTHWFDAISGWSPDPDESFRRAVALAEQAVCGAGSNASAHGFFGKVLLWQMRHEEAIGHLRQAVALAPGYAYMHFHLGDALTWSGRPDEAMPHLDRALRMDPNDHGVFLTLRGMACWMVGDLAAARAALDSALRRNPSYAWAHGLLTVVRHEAGDLDGARRAAHAGHRINRRFSLQFAARVLPFLHAEHRDRHVLAWRAAGLPEHEGVPGEVHR
jgi:DNA-binding SARP family transcriptional activator/Tfp pilus assembly protein PilF